MVIYKIENIINGKIYVGKTQRTVEERFKEHARHNKTYISKAIQKYGKENFQIEVIEICNNVDDLDERERYWINFFNCKVPNGYNFTDGGEGACGRMYRFRRNQSKKICLT